MQRDIYERIAEMANTAKAREETIAYLTQHLGGFLRSGERVDLFDGAVGHFLQEILFVNAVQHDKSFVNETDVIQL